MTAPSSTDFPSASTRTVLAQVFESLDYARLGPIYCDEGGDAFWAEHRQPALRLGIQWARALASRLPIGGDSLYVGAGVAELPALITEVLDLRRQVVVTNLHAEECEILNGALADVLGVGAGSELLNRLRYRCVDAAEIAVADGPFDHLAVVSVLNDPVTYPTISGVAYGNIPPVLIDLGAFERERASARKLVAELLGVLRVPGVVTTTCEEVSWWLAAAESRGLSVEADDEVIETAIVGDPLGFLRVT